MSLDVFLLVLFAALCHSVWNFAARKVSGNLTVLWLGLWTGSLVLLLPVLIILISGKGGELFSVQAVACILATGVLHGIYFGLLALAYRKGDISSVYPIARGSGVGLIAIAALFPIPFVLKGRNGTVRECVKIRLNSILLIGIGSILTYLIILFAFRKGSVSYIVPVRESGVIFAFLSGVFFLKEKATILKIVAVILIVTGIIMIKLQ